MVRKDRDMRLRTIIKGKGNQNVKPEGRPTMQNAGEV